MLRGIDTYPSICITHTIVEFISMVQSKSHSRKQKYFCCVKKVPVIIAQSDGENMCIQIDNSAKLNLTQQQQQQQNCRKRGAFELQIPIQ